MPPALTEQQMSLHDELVQRGNALVEGELLLGPHSRRKPGWMAKSKLRRALSYYSQALRIHPENWAVLWTAGKIHQRLSDQQEALRLFGQAHRIRPDQPDVAREAGIAATELGLGDQAVTFLNAAITAKPDDPGLLANLALAYLVKRDFSQAKSCAVEAVERNGQDQESRSVLELIRDVEAGKRPIPESFR